MALSKSIDWTIPNDLRMLGFNRPNENLTHRLVISSSSKEKKGKTHFAFTAPDPIGVLSIDIGTEGVVEKFLKKKRIILKSFLPASDMIKMRKQKLGIKKDTDLDSAKTEYEKTFTEIDKAYKALLASSSIRTIVMDTATEIFEILRLARFGKLTQVKPHHYGPVNDEYRTWVKEIYKTDKNLILLHKVKKQYVSTGVKDQEGNDKEAWNGEWERAGFNDTGFLVQVNLEHYRNEENGKFGIEVIDCRQNAECAGLRLEGKECTFPFLATQVFEDTTEEDWK